MVTFFSHTPIFTFTLTLHPTNRPPTMLHQTINCLLVIVLIVLFLVCCCYTPASFGDHASYGNEPFFNYRLANAMGPFQPNPTPPYDVNVGSAYPSQRNTNTSWTFATPFQSACSSGPNPAKCRPSDMFTCYLTPHNQRKCQWGTAPTYESGRRQPEASAAFAAS